MGSIPRAHTVASQASDEGPIEPSTDDQSCDSTVEILTRAQRGDRSAALILIERAAPAVRRWARGRLPQSARNDADTEDVVQDAVLKTLKGIAKFEHRTVGGLQAYLRTSVINRIRDLIRASGRRGVPETLDAVQDSQPSPLESAIMREKQLKNWHRQCSRSDTARDTANASHCHMHAGVSCARLARGHPCRNGVPARCIAQTPATRANR